MTGSHVGTDFLYDPFLRVGQREGEELGIECVEKMSNPGEMEALGGERAPAGIMLDVELQIEQFFEFQAQACLFEYGRRWRVVDGNYGLAQSDETILRYDFRREGFGHLVDATEDVGDGRGECARREPAVAQLFGERIDSSEASAR